MSSANTGLKAALRQILGGEVVTCAGAAVLMALSPAEGRAQAVEQTLPKVKAQEEVSSPPPVTQIGRTPQLLRDVPQTITVLDRETLDAQGATTLVDALRNVPGITLSAGEGGQIGDNVNLRGFSARTDLYVDGIRDRGQYARDTFFVESIEVLKGPSSMLFGRGSTGGVINQVTKQPRRQEWVQLGGSIGTDNYYRTTVDVNQPLGESAAFRVAAFGHSAESQRDIVETERYGVAPSLRLGMGTPTEITLAALVQRRHDIPDYGLPFGADGRPLNVPRENFLGFTDDRFEQDVDVLSARISHEFSPNFTLRNQTQYTQADIFARPTTINAAGVRNPRQREVQDSSLFNQTDLTFKFGGEALRHTVIAGAEIGRDTFENQTYNTTVPSGSTAFTQNLVNPAYGPLPATATIARNTFTDNEGNTLAFYVNDQLDIGEHWKLIGGIRWDRFEFDSTVTANSTGVVTVSPTKTDKMTSTRLGVVYQPVLAHTYYVSYGTSFNPSAETLTINTANQNLDPEENRSFEIGAKWGFADDQLLVTTAVFRVEKDNARTTDPVLLVATLDGETRVQGFEFGVSGKLTEAWSMLAGYTYLDGEIVELTETTTVPNPAPPPATRTVGVSRDGNVLPNTPEHNVSLWTTYVLPRGFEVGGGIVHASERVLNNANTARVGGYTRADVTAAYVTGRYSIRLNLQNVTDEEYFEVASAGRATPVVGRSAIATFNWKF